MPKVEDYVAYFKELAKKAGLTDEQAAPVLEVLKNDTIREGFVPRPNYSSDLDSMRDRSRVEAKAFYDDWYAREGKPAYDKALAVTDELGRYKQTYGDLDGRTSSTPAATYLTREQAEQLVNQTLAARDVAYTGLTKKAMKLATGHLHRFGEVLDPDELEKFATENKFTDLDSAYAAYTAPRIKAKEASEWEAKIKTAKEEGAREERSRLKVPVDYKPREYVNPFLQKRDIPKDSDPSQASREAFLDGWASKETKP